MQTRPRMSAVVSYEQSGTPDCAQARVVEWLRASAEGQCNALSPNTCMQRQALAVDA